MISDSDVREFKTLIDAEDKIYLISHKSPDGDNVGSTLALAIALKERYKNKDIIPLYPDDIDEYFNFIEETNLYIDYDDSEIPVLIALDCSDLNRIKNDKIYRNAKKIINIDHHASNNMFGDINFVAKEYSSTSELVYDILKKLDFNISKNCAKCIYIGINTDTGRFMYSSTTPSTMNKVSDLMKSGIDIDFINTKLYRSIPLNKILLMKIAIEKMNYEEDMIYTILENRDFISTNTSKNDCDEIVSLFQSIEGYDLSMVLKEDEGTFKASLRSKIKYDVSKIAQKFDGGGHIRASGFTSNLTYEEIVERVVEYAKE